MTDTLTFPSFSAGCQRFNDNFTSLPQINLALKECVERINRRPHSRFGVSRRERFESVEKAALKPLPATPFDVGEWKQVKLHPDCYVQLESAYYSAPHIHRGKLLRVKLTEHHIEPYFRNRMRFDQLHSALEQNCSKDDPRLR